MNIIDTIKSKMDANGDGKISVEDLEALKDSANKSVIDNLKKKADANKDGKLDLKDLESLPVNKWLKDLKGSIFGKK